MAKIWRHTNVRKVNIHSRSQSPRSSVGGIVGLWKNAEENQPLIGCLIISLTHSLLIENACNFNYSRSKIQTCLPNSVFCSLIDITPTQYRTMHSQAQYKLHIRKIYAQKNYTMQITRKHSTKCSHQICNWLALNMIQRFNTRSRVLKRTGDLILSSNIIFNSLQGLHR